MRRETAMQGGRLACGVGLSRKVGIRWPFGLQDPQVKRRVVLLWVELPWKKVNVSKRKQASRVFVLAVNHPIRPTPVNSEQA